MRTLRGSVAGAGGYWFMVAQALVGGSNLVFHVLVSRLLGPAAYGAFGSLLALLVLMTVPAGGLQTMATARTARLIDEGHSPDGRVVFARAMTVGVLCATVMLAAAPWLRALLRLDSTLPVVLLALYCLPLAAVIAPYNIAQGGRGAFAAWAGLPVAVLGVACWHAELWQLASVMIVAVLPSLLMAARWAFGAPAPVSGAAAPVGLPAPAEPVDLSIVVPFHNPGPALRRNVLRLFEELSGYGVSFEVIAVDDGSDDGSAESVADLDVDRVRLLSLPHNQGKGAALRHGLRAGNGRYLGFIYPDGDLDATLWRSFVSLIQLYEPDGVVGVERHPLTAVDPAASWTRKVCSYGYRGLVRLLFPALPVRDARVGLKVFRRDVLAGVLPYCVERRSVLDLELLALANRFGYRRILPAPVSRNRGDRSGVTPRVLVRIFADTLALAWRFHCSDRYPPAVRRAGAAAVPHAGAQPAVPLNEVV